MTKETREKLVSFDSEQLILVDENDEPTGSARKDRCHDGEGILHRAFSVFLWDANGKVILQKRASGKRLWGDYWSNSCCSHPRLGESMALAVERRLAEELGVQAHTEFVYKFVYRASFGYLGSEYECCSVFLGRTTDRIKVNNSEIAEWKAVDSAELTAALENQNDQFTPWCQQEWRELMTTYQPQFTQWLESAGQAAP